MIRIELDSLIDGGERRNFYRVEPSPEAPVIVETSAGCFKVLEISGGGCRLPVSFSSVFREQSAIPVILELPAGAGDGTRSRIPLKVRGVNCGRESVGVKFVELDSQLRELICDYVLRREIELARQRRARRFRP